VNVLAGVVCVATGHILRTCHVRKLCVSAGRSCQACRTPASNETPSLHTWRQGGHAGQAGWSYKLRVTGCGEQTCSELMHHAWLRQLSWVHVAKAGHQKNQARVMNSPGLWIESSIAAAEIVGPGLS
jgi:hypothetical protein